MPLIDAGLRAPRFSLRDQHGKSHDLADYAGRVVVLYFYPEDDTVGCTDEACQFRDHLPDFRKIKAVVLGVSPDGEASHAAFDQRHDLNFTLLADEPRDGTPRVCDQYGVWREHVVFGTKSKGVVRTTYVIDKQGRVARRWDAVRVPGHAGDVLAAVRSLHAGEKPLDIEGNVKPLKRGKRAKLRAGKRDTNPPLSPSRGTLRAGRGKTGLSRSRTTSTGSSRKSRTGTKGKPRRV